MKYCIIGGGISGLSTAYFIRKKYPNSEIVLIEKTSKPGGLGSWIEVDGFSIEPYYHHFFESDKKIRELAAQLNIENKLYFKRAKSAYYFDGEMVQLSGPLELLFFKKLTIIERLRVVLSMVYLKLLNDGSILDRYTVKEWMEKWIGKRAYSILWQPLMKGKFEKHADDISMSWMWGRIHDRTVKLGYFKGGVRVFLSALEKWLIDNNVQLHYETSVSDIRRSKKGFSISTDKQEVSCDKLIFTTISPVFAKIAGTVLDQTLVKNLSQIQHIGTVCLLLILKSKVQDNYWINMCSKKSPYLISIEHTNFADKADYDDNTLFYLAKYSDKDDAFYKKSTEYYITEAIKTLKLLNPKFKRSDILEYRLAKVPASQTLFKKGYSHIKPDMKTSDPNIYLINIDQTFPHDRNLNMGIMLANELVASL